MALFKFNLKHQDCIDSHKSFYNEDFEVLPMRRRNYFDIFPLNLLIAYIDPPGSGEWDGIISTNGKKIVMTEGKMLNLAKHKKVYEFNLDEIDSITSSYYGITMIFKNHVKGLTKSKGNYFLKYFIFIFSFSIAFMLQSFLFKGKIADIHLKDDFKNEDKFKSLLKLED
tara:strand:+ start:70 stop:576 length:507 start_codon:yes stop_codon:yes gene_type:complete